RRADGAALKTRRARGSSNAATAGTLRDDSGRGPPRVCGLRQRSAARLDRPLAHPSRVRMGEPGLAPHGRVLLEPLHCRAIRPARHGLSDHTDKGFDLDTWVDDLGVIVDSLGIERFDLFGLSQ